MIYNYDEVKRFFSVGENEVFRMSEVRGGIIIPKRPRLKIEVDESRKFRIGPYILYLHDETESYYIASFAC